MKDTTVVEIECVNTANNTVIAQCWEAASRTARVQWYYIKRIMEISYEELFQTKRYHGRS